MNTISNEGKNNKIFFPDPNINQKAKKLEIGKRGLHLCDEQ